MPSPDCFCCAIGKGSVIVDGDDAAGIGIDGSLLRDGLSSSPNDQAAAVPVNSCISQISKAPYAQMEDFSRIVAVDSLCSFQEPILELSSQP